MSHYSLSWAREVYSRFESCYPRATKDVLNFYGLDRDWAIYQLANNQEAWEKFKHAVKYFYIMVQHHKLRNSRVVRQQLSWQLGPKCWPYWKKELDKEFIDGVL